MELYETSDIWKRITLHNPYLYEWTQRQRALICVACLEGQECNKPGFAFVDGVRLEIEGDVAKAALPMDCDVIERIYGLSGHEAWFVIGDLKCPISDASDPLRLVAICSPVWLCVKGAQIGAECYSFPVISLKKGILKASSRKTAAFSKSFGTYPTWRNPLMPLGRTCCPRL